MSKKQTAEFAAHLKELADARGGAGSPEAIKTYYFPNQNAWYDYACIFLNWGLALIWLSRFALSFLRAPLHLLWLPLLIPVSFFLADFSSALFHKWLDSYASEQSFFWGSSARAFRIHHEFPHNLNETTLWHNVSAFASFSTLLNLLGIFGTRAAAPELQVVLWTMILIFTYGTEIHKQAHRPHPRAFFRLGQKTGFFLQRDSHLNHHRGALNSDYGIVNNWSGLVLNRFGLWAGVDRLVWKTFGILPHNWIQAPDTVPALLWRKVDAGQITFPKEILMYHRLFPHRAGTELRGRLRSLSEA